ASGRYRSRFCNVVASPPHKAAASPKRGAPLSRSQRESPPDKPEASFDFSHSLYRVVALTS
ncbi:MAG: hypothetical protein ACR2G5_12135, partial [Pyrinomonadaceae bacterium]